MTPSSFNLYFLISLAVLSQTYPSRAQTCYNDRGNFTSGSAYAKNRDAVLSYLSPNVTAQDGFYATNAGESPDTVYAITFCRGDASADDCGSCVRSGVEDLAVKCPNQTAAYFMYSMPGEPPCMIRYSNTPIYGILDVDLNVTYYNTDDLTMDQEKLTMDQFVEIWRNFTLTLMSKAANGSSKLKYVADQVKLPDNQTIYSVMQCSPDLMPIDCRRCLFLAIDDYDRRCRGKSGGGVNMPSCIFRWELYSFFESKPSPPPSLSSPPLQAVLPPAAAPPARGTNIGKGGKSNSTRTVIIAVATSVSAMLAIGVFVLLTRKKKKQQLTKGDEGEVVDEISTEESLQFDFGTVRAATDNFSDSKKLGQGGFGAVYMGRLSNGQDIAVKRLSHNSSQGELEFKNEVMILARLQHRNLVKLLGFCLEGVERLLIYEFLPNSSLDKILIDPLKRAYLVWDRRHKIIMGVARRLLYLHEDSRLRIIHRDLKASNILLDSDMNPKISDFGIARLFKLDETQAMTDRIVGTYGYMAPEYVNHGKFSVKSDVFSFGVLVLEIVSGQRNNLFRLGDNTEVLTSYVWKKWREGSISNIIDPSITSGLSTEIARCINIGLLCAQENVASRPTMASVLLMLNSHSITLQVPSRPAFFMHHGIEFDMSATQDYSSRVHEVERSRSQFNQFSKNEASMTDPCPR